MRRVMDDVRHQTAVNNPGSSTSSNANANGAETNGGKKANGSGSGSSNGVEAAAAAGGADDKANLALPQAVVEDALRVTRESLEMVCEIEGGGT